MILSLAEKHSSAWQRLHLHYGARLQLLREKNDQAMSEKERDKLIGKIEEVKELLALNNDPVVPE
jgi:hypothetical protein